MRKLFSIIAVTLTASILTTSVSAADTFGGAQVADSGSGMKVVIVDKAAQNAIIAKNDITMETNSEQGGSSGDNNAEQRTDLNDKLKNILIGIFGSEDNLINNTEVINKPGDARGVSRVKLPNSESKTAFDGQTLLNAMANGIDIRENNNPTLNEYFGYIASVDGSSVKEEIQSDYGDSGTPQDSSYWKMFRFTPGFITGGRTREEDSLDCIVDGDGSVNSIISDKMDGVYSDGLFCYGNLFNNTTEGLLEDAFILIEKILKGNKVSEFSRRYTDGRDRTIESLSTSYVQNEWINKADRLATEFLGKAGKATFASIDNLTNVDEVCTNHITGEGREGTVFEIYVSEMTECLSAIKVLKEELEYLQNNPPSAPEGGFKNPEEAASFGAAMGQYMEKINKTTSKLAEQMSLYGQYCGEWGNPYNPYSVRAKLERFKYGLKPEYKDDADVDNEISLLRNRFQYEKAYDEYVTEKNRYESLMNEYNSITDEEKKRRFWTDKGMEKQPYPPVEPTLQNFDLTEETYNSNYTYITQEKMNSINDSMFTPEYIRYKNAVNTLDAGVHNLTYNPAMISSYEEQRGVEEDAKIDINKRWLLEEIAWYYYVKYGRVGFPTDEEIMSLEDMIALRQANGEISYTLEQMRDFERWLLKHDLFFSNSGGNQGYSLGPDKDIDLLIELFGKLNTSNMDGEGGKPGKLGLFEGYENANNILGDNCQYMDDEFYYINGYINGSYNDIRKVHTKNGVKDWTTQECAIRFMEELGIFGGDNLSPDQWLSATYYTDVSVVDYANNKLYHSGNFQRYEWYVLYNPGKGASRNDSNTKAVYHNTTTAKTCPFTPVESGTYWVECYQSSKSSYGEHLYYNIRNFLVDETTQMVLFSTMDFGRQEKIAEKLIPEKIALRCNENGVYVSKGQNVKWRADEGQIILDSFTTERVPDNVFDKYGG